MNGTATRAKGNGAKGNGNGSSLAADPRMKTLQATMKRHQYQADALIEVLHTAQELFGHLDLELLVQVANGLKLPPSRVYGVATFYHFFSLTPKGAHTCTVCMGTACYVKGAAQLVSAVERAGDVQCGETRADGALSLHQARCIGACGIAPAVILDGKVVGAQTPETLAHHVKGWLPDGSR
jgi:bidirectional [NiFe] hydrogenase diaphorase subunit